MTKDIYIELVNRIYDKCPSVKWVDLWNNQINNESREYPIPFPAVFLYLKEATDTPIGNGTILQVSGIITALCVFENYDDHYKADNDNEINTNALNFFDFKDEVSKALHGFRPEKAQSLFRRSQRMDSSFNNLYINEIDFEIVYCEVIDDDSDYILEEPVFAYEKEII